MRVRKLCGTENLVDTYEGALSGTRVQKNAMDRSLLTAVAQLVHDITMSRSEIEVQVNIVVLTYIITYSTGIGPHL